MFLKKLLVALISLGMGLNLASADDIQSFREAKREMPKIFKQLDNPQTLYCGCDITFPKKGYMVNLKSCGYKIRKNASRAKRIEAEHIVSAWEFAHQRQCWINGGRKNCERNDNLFKTMEGDLHNLYPAVGEINGDRSNYRFAKVVRGPKNYGQCEMIIDRKRQLVNPPIRARGIIARAYLYMQDRYRLKLSSQQQSLFNEWNRAYKVTPNECKRNALITKIQGNDNPFVTAQCKKLK